MNKKNCLIFGLALLLSAPAMVLTSCGKKHEYSSDWTHDGSSHWHVCVKDGHDDTSDNAAHEFGNWVEKTPAGVHKDKVEQRTCTVCGYAEERTVENTGLHSYSDEWEHDSKQHWHACTIEGCDAKKDAGNHTLTNVEAVEATCTAEGNIAHKHCSGCDKNFDADGNEIANVKIPAKGHTYSDLIAKKDATCISSGMKAHYECSSCGAYFDEDKNPTTKDALVISIDADAHDYTEWIAQVEPNCATKTNGTKGHYDCKDCGKHFDADKNEITDLTIEWSHTLGETVYLNDTSHGHKCSVCGEAGYDDFTEAHTLEKNKRFDETYHYDYCTVCKHSVNSEEHTFGEPVVTIEATYTTQGSQTETCTVCGYGKVSAIPVLAAKDRTITYTGATSKIYDGKAFDLGTSTLKVTTTSTDASITSINRSGGKETTFYTDEECTNKLDSAPKDAGKYYFKAELDATAEWQAASLVVPFEIKPIVVTTFTPGELLQVKSSTISSDGTLTLAENTSVDGQSVKATAKLNNYKGLGTYTFSYSDIVITDADGSTTTDYLKNYVVTDNSASTSDTITVQVYDEFVNSFTLSKISSVTKDTSSGQTVSTFVATPKLDSGKSLSLTVGGKLLMGGSYVTITEIKIGTSTFTDAGTTKIIYSSDTTATFTGTVVGLFSESTLIGKTFTLHSHDFNEITGACVCGESLGTETILHGTETGKEYTLTVYNHKAYYNFNKCSNHTGYFEIRVDGIEANDNPIESIIVYKKDGTSVGEMTFKSTSYYNYQLSNSYNLFTANTQYYVVFTLKESCAYDELTATIGQLGHRYDDSGTCTCGATLS